MRAFATFALAMLLSMLGAQTVAQILAVQFGAREEFILVMFMVGLFAVISITMMSIAFVAGYGVAPIDLSAAATAALAIVATLAVLVLGMWSDGWRALNAYDLKIATEFLVSALTATFIQWLLVRRYRRKHME